MLYLYTSYPLQGRVRFFKNKTINMCMRLYQISVLLYMITYLRYHKHTTPSGVFLY